MKERDEDVISASWVGQEKNRAMTHSSMTVMARHSTMAGCEGGSRGISEDGG